MQNGEKSCISEVSTATTDESTPSEPMNLKVLAVTSTVIKIGWEAPGEMNGILKSYYVYKDNQLMDQTNETFSVLGGLHPGIVYEFQVCASTVKGKGEKASIKTSTCDIGGDYKFSINSII